MGMRITCEYDDLINKKR